MTYCTFHSAITHVGHTFFWVVTDFTGTIVNHGKTLRREAAREEMRKAMKKLRKQPEKAGRHREPMFETWHRNNPE